MKLSYNWLKELCGFEMSAHDLATELSRMGFCVETYEPRGEDWLLDVEITTNRPDCLSHLGIAREIAAVTGLPVKRLPAEPAEAGDVSIHDFASVEVTAPDLCPHYTARVITGVRVGPSPGWMQQRLMACGLRPINNVVDATNYVLLESGQPLHAFDLSLLNGRKIIVRRAAPGETIVTIDGTQCKLTDQMCVIADASRAVAVAGAMGGAESEIGETTADVLLESARFDPVSVRRTSRALGLSSDSSYRFERGVDPENVEAASRRAALLILDTAGGMLARSLADIRADATEFPTVGMRLERLAAVLGIEVPVEEVRKIFRGLELTVTDESNGTISVRVPSWRGDLRREIDLIEEVARIHGYDKISETTAIPVSLVTVSPEERCKRVTRECLAGQGFNEVVTSSLVADDGFQQMQPWHTGRPLKVRNPITVEKSCLRLTNLANLLSAKKFNLDHGTPKVHLFELGKIYLPPPDSGDGLPEEKLCLSLLSDEKDGLLHLKGVFENLLQVLGVEQTLEEVPQAAGLLSEGESLLLELGGRQLGWVGVVSEAVAVHFDLPDRPALLEVDLGVLTESCGFDRSYRPVPEFPASRRDMAVVLPEEVTWAELEGCVMRSAPDSLESIEFLDLYRGEQIPDGCKSIAFSVIFRLADRTLTGEDTDAAQDQILNALRSELGAELR